MLSSTPAARGQEAPGDKVVLALMGANSRGSYLARQFAQLPNVEFAYVCDPDERAIDKGTEAASREGGAKPKGIRDFRHALDDPQVDALICATPNHWHAAAAINACAAGKHVYVEKPACQYPGEGEAMIEAARQAGTVVEVGMQRRSSPAYQRAVELVRGGTIGDVLYAKSWYYAARPSIGTGQQTAPPDWLDYDLWQGPRTARPYQDNLIHYNWHWFWHWGNGEIGNNGVHTIDICRWALDVAFPNQVAATGGRWRYDDDQQTPDTMTATFDCDGRQIVWEGLSWSPAMAKRPSVGIELRGTNGSMQIDDQAIITFDEKGKQVESFDGQRGDRQHFENFVASIRGNATPNCGVVEGHRSALFCHLANAAFREGRQIEIDSADGRFTDAELLEKYWQPEQRPGWAPPLPRV